MSPIIIRTTGYSTYLSENTSTLYLRNLGKVIAKIFTFEMINASLSPWHDATSGYRWRRRFLEMKGSCEYNE
jgi:hypothetical protein